MLNYQAAASPPRRRLFLLPKIISFWFAYYPDSTTIWMQYEPKGGNYMQYKHLVCVTGQNNNKYYDMREKPDGTFDATYGRIGATATTINYPMSKWDSTLNSKLRKGYEDMTELAVITDQLQGRDHPLQRRGCPGRQRLFYDRQAGRGFFCEAWQHHLCRAH